MAENVDLAKTFEAIGGTSMPSDGHSLLPAMSGVTPPDWRNAILVEHHGPDLDGGGDTDPDSQDQLSGNPPSYEAMRTPDYLYVEYRDDEREFYDLRTDPYELHNIVSSLTPGSARRAARGADADWRTATPATPAGRPGTWRRTRRCRRRRTPRRGESPSPYRGLYDPLRSVKAL